MYKSAGKGKQERFNRRHSGPLDGLSRREISVILVEEMKKMGGRKSQIIALILGGGYSKKTIGEGFGLSASRVYSIYNDYLRRLKENPRLRDYL